MESKNFCASEDLPFGTIQSRSAYSRSKAGCRPSFGPQPNRTPPSSLRVASSLLRLLRDAQGLPPRRRTAYSSYRPSPLFSFIPPCFRVPAPSPGRASHVPLPGPASRDRAETTYASYPASLAAFHSRGSTVTSWLSLSQLRTPFSGLSAPASLISASIVVDLLLVERDRLEEGIGLRVVIGEILVDHGGDPGRVVEGALGGSSGPRGSGSRTRAFIQCGDHPRNTIGSFAPVLLVQLGEHRRRARLDELHVQVVPGDDLVLDLGMDGALGSMPMISSVPAWSRSAMLLTPSM